MITQHPDRPGLPRLVVDVGVYVSAAISGTGPPTQLLEAAIEGRVVLLVSPLLLDELRDVLTRNKFRRWLSQADADAFIDALILLAEVVDDPPESSRQRVCRDPDDDYLVALTEAQSATMLVSGDADLHALHRPDVDVRSPRSAVEAILYEHSWGPPLIPADPQDAWASAEAAGNAAVLRTVAVFLSVIQEEDGDALLPFVVTPDSLPAWRAQLGTLRAALGGRGMATKVEYPSPDIAYVKLPPDPAETIKATGDVITPAEIVTLVRRPDLPETPGSNGWRVHAAGDYWRPDD